MEVPPLKLCIFVTHPVQYHTPIWRTLARHPDLEVKVFYFNDQSVRGGLDKEFGVRVAWDVDLLGGYESTFLSRDAPLDRVREMRIDDVDGLLERERPDWVFFAGYTHAFERQLARRAHAHGARILMRGEFSDLSFGARPFSKRLIRSAYLHWFYSHVDRFCYIGEDAKKHLARFGISSSRMFFSPYSVDDSIIATEHRNGEARRRFRAELGISDGQFVFIFSGKLIPRKDPFAVLEALRQVPAIARERMSLIVLGNGEMRDAFTAEATALLGSRFIFPGFVNQSGLSKYLAASDAMVMPSRFETWGLVVNEAMHVGLPCIVSSQVGCAPDLVLEGRTGFVYPVGESAALADRMQRLAAAPQAAHHMGDAARRHMERYNIDATVRGILEALERPLVLESVA